jgi:Integrase core domain
VRSRRHGDVLARLVCVNAGAIASRRGILRLKTNLISSGRPIPGFSRITCSKNTRPGAEGRSRNLRGRELCLQDRDVVAVTGFAVCRRQGARQKPQPFAQQVSERRRDVSTLMRRMEIEAIYRRPNTSKPAPGHRIYPYLLRGLMIDRPNHVWAAHITCIPMARGFVYLTAVMDWFVRRVLAWRLPNMMEASFCINAVQAALAKHACPQIFNTDRGSQFTSAEFTSVLINNGISISMDGKGAWRDNAPLKASAKHVDRSPLWNRGLTSSSSAPTVTSTPSHSDLSAARTLSEPEGSSRPFRAWLSLVRAGSSDSYDRLLFFA